MNDAFVNFIARLLQHRKGVGGREDGGGEEGRMEGGRKGMTEEGKKR